MRAMTWWDHETQSVWSQPWGLAIGGALEGTRLRQIPAAIVPWGTWLDEHPDTSVLLADGGRFGYPPERFDRDYVIGIALGEHAKAYPFARASEEGVVNDHLGQFPVAVVADSETKSVHTFIRLAGDLELEFTLVEGALRDIQTGTSWDPSRGLAIDGPLRGAVLQRVPYSTAFDWAWEDFYPHTEFYQGG